jgi:diadenosine tetraphosphate (Ap4A) HIT family hydrolase
MLAELYGGAWADLDGWLRRCEPASCVVCTAGRPFGIVGELSHTWITTDPDVAIYGYVCVISKIHAVEPFELSDDDQIAFWRESMLVARQLNELVRPVKMNYEIHGNTLPHLHMQLIPRRPDDAFVGRPVDLKETHHRYTPEDTEKLRAIFAALAELTDGSP